MDVKVQQCYLAGLGYYKLRRKDGTVAIDGIPGQATKNAIYNFQMEHRKRLDGSVLSVDGIFGSVTEKALREVIGNNETPQIVNPTTNASSNAPEWWVKYPAVKRNDWRCRCGGRFCNGFPVEPHEKTVSILQKFSDHFGKPILWNSGIRCNGYNATIKGASPNSKHRLGMAYDFHMDGVSPKELFDYGETLMPNWGGIGLYSWGIHIDDRPVKARWRG